MNETIKIVLALTIPYLKELILSKVVPAVKRRAYAAADSKINTLINDLAQNAAKISKEDNPVKKEAYIEGTRLGIDTIPPGAGLV